jgi:PKD repeat protein
MARSTRPRRALAGLGMALLFLLAPMAAESKNCEVGSPAVGVPDSLWGTLKPTDVGQLPDPRDSTNYDGSQRPDDTIYKVPLFTSLDVENGWIFETYTQGFKIWDATGGNAANPALTATRDCQAAGFLRCLPGQHEVRELFWDVDAPEGVDSVVALASAPLGFMVFDTTNKGNPRQVYEDYNRGMLQVWSATIGGRHWAFGVEEGSNPGNSSPGIQLYDLTAALSLTGCIDDPNARNCGPHKGRIGQARGVSYIDGFRRGDGQFFIAVSTGGPGGLEIWNVSSPQAASPVATLFANDFIYGTAIWEQGGKQFLAVQYILPGGAGQGGRIYDVSSCLNGNCAGLAPIWSKSWSVGASRHFVTYSKSGNKHFLYWGNEDKCSGGLQREWLYDVSNVASGGQPVDLTPPGRLVVSNFGETATVDYWSYYYASNPSGFSEVMPRMGKVVGSYFYRAAWTIFDVHEITGGLPPSANFTWAPTTVYPGDLVTFTDTSGGFVTSRTWTFPGGATSSSNPATFTFSSPGAQPVNLQVANDQGPDSRLQNVPVLDPAPAVAGAGASPTTAYVCQPITLTASGVTGKSPLAVSWAVLDAGNSLPVAANISGSNPAVWDTTNVLPGSYKGIPTASNGFGSATLPTGSAPTITLQALPSMPGGGTFAPSNDAFAAGTVQFHVNAAGATSWKWDFGDGSPQVETNDPVNGPHPVHSYSSTGQKNVKVTIDNCVDSPRDSSTLQIQINQINPLLINTFQALCNVAPCVFGVGEPITFLQDVSGEPTLFEYDWDGNGSFEQSGPAIVPTHTYDTASTYNAKLRIVRGAETKEAIFTLVVSGDGPPPPPPPSITIGGPSSGNANQALSFSASASNCTPAASWSWSASGGGSVAGNGSSVNVTWSNDGAQTLTVTNTGCSGATGSKSVQIGSGVPNPGGLNPNFTFSPAGPQAGQAVSFDASSSSGAPTSYNWNFGDGQTASSSGPTISHTYGAAGSYNVTLEVGKPGNSCQFNFCTANVSKTVVVGSGGPSLVASFDTNAECIAEFGINQCTAHTGTAVAFTSTSQGATSQSWNFGDGGTASGGQVSHTWTAPGNYQVQLTVGNGSATASAGRFFIVTGPPVQARKSVVLPWIAQSRGTLDQSSDLYLLNVATEPLQVTIKFLKPGKPEANPPTHSTTVAPGATFFVADVLDDLFGLSNASGFLVIETEGSAEPIITSFNITTADDGSQFGQSIPGSGLGALGGEPSSLAARQHLVGLSDNGPRLSNFGISNPHAEEARYKLRFFDKTGKLIGQSVELALAPFGQKRFLPKEIRAIFGIKDIDDYRVEIETTQGLQLFPFATLIETASDDPSYVQAGDGSGPARVHLVGVFGTEGIGGSRWITDAVLANVSSQVLLVDLRFLAVGVKVVPTDAVGISLQPGETRRLLDVLGQFWNVHNKVGVLLVDSHSADGIFPVVQGEVYDSAKPALRFGQAMPSLSRNDAAEAGQSRHLVGLRQNASYRSTVTLFNSSAVEALFDVIYRGLDGKVLGTLANQRLGAGKARQLNPEQHKLPAGGVAGGFSVEVKVKTGEILAAGQVVNNLTNDPAYVQGEVR